jgi:glyoxylase-like metal-dependent hydrolase (beta-lactamase superfamily II)
MFKVTRLQDGTFEIPADAFIYVGDEAKGAGIRAEKAGTTTPVPVNCFLLRGNAEVILVDTGAGSAWGPGLGHARAALAAEGIPPEAVDRVILTHVHGDHALGLFEGDAAYFPRARVSVPAPLASSPT